MCLGKKFIYLFIYFWTAVTINIVCYRIYNVGNSMDLVNLLQKPWLRDSSFTTNPHPLLTIFSVKCILITTPLLLSPIFSSPFLRIPLSVVHFTPPPFVSPSLHLSHQTANLWGWYFLFICRALLLPISTSERLLLMVLKEKKQPWIHTRPLPLFCRGAGRRECHILLPPVSAKLQL